MLSCKRHVGLFGFLLLLEISLAPGARALETDNYFAWGKKMADSRSTANQTMNRMLERWSAKANAAKTPLTCGEFAKGLYSEFMTMRGQTKANWDPFRAEMIPASNQDLPEFFKKHSIYRVFSQRIIGQFTHLAGNININGVTMGVDKIAHFVLIGYEYFEIYQKQLAQGATPEEALVAALEYGISTEKGKLGLWFLAFSYGDLEADYQGLLFYNDLCAGASPFVKWSRGSWVRTERQFDWAEYVSGEFDETFNANGHEDRKWADILPYVKPYCGALSEKSVLAQRHYYQTKFIKSYSQQYMEIQEALGKTPRRRMVEAVCGG